MQIGITGASGFIGSNFVNWLKSNNAEYSIFEHRLSDHGKIDAFIRDNDVIVHLAGVNRGNDQDILYANVLGTFHIAACCLELKKKLIVAGSEYVGGSYGASKKLALRIVEEFRPLGLSAYYLCIPNVYGPGCKPSYNSFVSTVLDAIATKKPYRNLIHYPDTPLELVHVSDLCKIFGELCYTTEADLMKQGYCTLPRYYIPRPILLRTTIGAFCETAEGKITDVSSMHREKIMETLKSYEQT